MADRPPPRAAVTVVTALRRTLLRLADRLLPAHLAVWDKSIGVGRTGLLGAFAELGVADALASGPQTAEQLATRLDVDADTLHRVLRAGAVEDVVKMDRRGRFKLTRLSNALRSDHPHSARDWARYIALPSTTAAWADVTESIRTGRSAFPRVHGMSIWTWFEQHPDEERTFAGAMRWLTEEIAPSIAAAYDWPQNGTVCDVAGGVGTLLAGVLRARPDLRGVLVDGSGVLDEADAWLTSQGLRDRVELRPGNIFERVEADADVYLLKDVLHDWDDAACTKIIATVRATMKPGSRLVLVEDLQERNRPSPTASLTDVHMLTQTDDGRQRSADELRALMEAAGLRPGSVKQTIGPALVEGLA